jgi:hypothetical protein
MSSSNDSSVVLRLPQDLKKSLQEQAEQLDISLSEVIRIKLLIAEDAVHKEPVIRLGTAQYRLWDVLRPDVLSYELVSSGESARSEVVFIEEVGAKKLPIGGTVSEAVERAIGRSREEAIRLGSTSIAPVHVAIALLADESNAVRAIDHLCHGHRHVLDELEAEARAFPSHDRSSQRGDVRLAKATEKALKLVPLEAKLHGRKVADTTMLLLALLRLVESPVQTFAALRVNYRAVADLVKR